MQETGLNSQPMELMPESPRQKKVVQAMSDLLCDVMDGDNEDYIDHYELALDLWRITRAQS